jgi:hypothetical protein
VEAVPEVVPVEAFGATGGDDAGVAEADAAEALAAGEIEPPESRLLVIDRPPSVWLHPTIEFVQVTRCDRQLSVEIGYLVAWREEYTLAARFRDGQLVELCSSVSAPYRRTPVACSPALA